MQCRPSTTASALALCTAAFVLALAGCAPPAPQDTLARTPQETVSAVCASADALAASIDEFRNTLSPEVTIEQIEMARDKVSAAYDVLAAEARDVAQERAGELKTHVEPFQKAVKDVSNGAKVSDAIDSLKSETDAVDSSLGSLANELKCQG